MSYCRFSCDDFKSDVYVYKSCFGWFQIEVASNRRVITQDLPPKVGMDKPEEWLARHQKVMEIIEQSPLEPIGLEFDGETFTPITAWEAAVELRMLRESGYHIPDGVIEALEEDQP